MDCKFCFVSSLSQHIVMSKLMQIAVVPFFLFLWMNVPSLFIHSIDGHLGSLGLIQLDVTWM